MTRATEDMNGVPREGQQETMGVGVLSGEVISKPRSEECQRAA